MQGSCAWPPFELIRRTQDKDILVEAHSPIAHGELLKHESVAVPRIENYGDASMMPVFGGKLS